MVRGTFYSNLTLAKVYGERKREVENVGASTHV
jgi:hypothetical protein